MQSILQFIVGGLALLKSAVGDADVVAFLSGKKRNLLDPVPQGVVMGEAAQQQQEARDQEDAERNALTDQVEKEFAALEVEMHDFQFAAKRDLAKTPDLARKLGIKLPVRHRKGRKADASKEADAAKDAPSPAKPEAGQTPADGEKKVRKHRIPRLARFLARSKPMIKKALSDPAIVKAMSPHGYTQEELTSIARRLADLEQMSKDQGVAKKTSRAATAGLHDSVKEFRSWFTPWKRRLTHALKGRDDLRTKLGLPVPHREGSRRKGDGEADGQPAGEKGSGRGRGGQPKPPSPPAPPKAQ